MRSGSYVHNNGLYNSQDMKSTSMSTDLWMEKKTEYSATLKRRKFSL